MWSRVPSTLSRYGVMVRSNVMGVYQTLDFDGYTSLMDTTQIFASLFLRFLGLPARDLVILLCSVIVRLTALVCNTL